MIRKLKALKRRLENFDVVSVKLTENGSVPEEMSVINGSRVLESMRTSNIRDHAKSDQHKHAMDIYRRGHSTTSTASGSGPGPIQRMTFIPITVYTLNHDVNSFLVRKCVRPILANGQPKCCLL